jgi:hypothetical protein
MKKYFICIYNIYIDFIRKTNEILYGNDYNQDDAEDEYELDSLLSNKIDHPFDESDKVLVY